MTIAYAYFTKRGTLPLKADVPDATSREEAKNAVRRDMPRHEVEGTTWDFLPDLEGEVAL